MSAAIHCENLSKTYQVGNWFKKRKVVALEGLNLSVSEGQIYGLLGPNGAGKSTTIKLLIDIIQPTVGKALVFGKLPADFEARKVIGYLPENPAPYEYLSGEEFVTYAGQLNGLSGDTLKSKVISVIEKVQMSQAANLQIRRYSKGMIQRISLAQALVGDPKLLILDEPTSGLDVLGRQLIRDLILEERKKGTSVLLCSHIIPDVEALCDSVAVIIGGKLVQEGSVSSLLSSGSTQVELVLDGESLEVMKTVSTEVDIVRQRATVKLDETKVNEALALAAQHSLRIVSLNRTKYSLEALFLDALKKSDRKVGGLIS
jgi:ABC-2 type transport system ATP-binding protein